MQAQSELTLPAVLEWLDMQPPSSTQWQRFGGDILESFGKKDISHSQSTTGIATL
jgi:hypothetical protein